MNPIFITGISSGIGHALAKTYLSQNRPVFGLSRRTPQDLITEKNCHFLSCDLEQLESLPKILTPFIKNIQQLDLVILNAGILGNLQDLKDASINELKEIMDINLWANKVILDTLFSQHIKIDQVITLSSGAAVNGNRGWAGYALSKAALNMLTQLYAKEEPNTHFTALAPGLVDTPMQDYLCGLTTLSKFPSLKHIQDARHTPNMPTPDELAPKLISHFSEIMKLESGRFTDIRTLV